VKSYPKISVVIPSYNKDKYIGSTLDSIINQKYPNLEVIIQDGGSTDGTLDIIKKYAKEYSNVIKYESKKDKGQLHAINNGFGKVTGEILAYINADDVYGKGSFESVAKLFASNSNSLWFAGRGRVIDSSGKEIAKFVTWYKNLLLSLNSRFFLLVTNYLMQPSVFITRNAWKRFGPFTGTPDFVMEYDLWLKIAKDEMPVISDKYFSAFRIEPSTITKTDTDKLLSEDKRIVRKYTDNSLILGLHKIHNYMRRLVGITV
jgi:glycosyltransferase involved in cell wall biosynthesis